MKHKLAFSALLLALGAGAYADGLNREHISADAKWLLHLDCDNLRQTQVGGFLLNHLVAPKAEEIGNGLKFNVSNVLQRISSVTAYGVDFTKGPDAAGVLLINSDAETETALEGLLVAQILTKTNGPVKKLANDDQPLYCFGNEVFIAPQKGGPIVISKSRAQVEAAQELLAGKAPSLGANNKFSQWSVTPNSFFFLGVADALNVPNQLPAQAKVLQMADGGRIALGEMDEQVFLDLALHGKNTEVTRQIQQVIEGMIALVSLSQPDNPDLTELTKTIKVSSKDGLITIRMEYPASKAIAKLNEQMTPKTPKEKPPRHKVRSKAKQKQGFEAGEPANQSDQPTPQPEQPAAKPAAEEGAK